MPIAFMLIGKDIRVIANIKPNAWEWAPFCMSMDMRPTLNILTAICPGLCSPAHIFTTEAIAMMFDRFESNPVWIQEMLGILERMQHIGEDCNRYTVMNTLVFAGGQVMYRFEKHVRRSDQNLTNLVESSSIIMSSGMGPG